MAIEASDYPDPLQHPPRPLEVSDELPSQFIESEENRPPQCAL